MSHDISNPIVWDNIVKLASVDRKDDVCRILERMENTKELCDLLRSLPSLKQIGSTARHRGDYDDHVKQLRVRAKAFMNRKLPADAYRLLALYAGEKIEPMGWLEDLVFSYAWTT